MKDTVVLYPGLAVSHFVPMMQLTDALQEAGYAVAVALIDPAMKEDIAFAAVVRRVISSKPSVAFHTLPRIQDPPAMTHDVPFFVWYFDLVRRYNQHLDGFLRSLPHGSVHAVIVDAASSGALGVAKKLGVPAFTFYAMNASALAVFLQAPSFRTEGQASFKELGDTRLDFHGVPPMPASHLLGEMLEDPESEVYKVLMDGLRGIPDLDGVLVNTFASLEPRAVAALGDPRRLPSSPPVYCVGPLVADAGEDKAKHEWLTWLDEQPEHSVVYLCFGSLGAGSHSEEQLKEIAAGLENSGHRFVWVVRAPPPLTDDPERPFDPRAEPDLDALLPDGFLERTSSRGRVVNLWAPQVDVLRHPSTGAFVTHCGWNSVLEAITARVPMLCWPLYSEQKMNKVFIVEEAGVGVEVVGWQQGLVKSGELEAKVRLVMESEEGERLRARVAAHSEAAAAAWKDGGSSRAAFARFLSDAGDLKPVDSRA